jgi:predicted 2-oxoglutarate/Fe(II)-dependent dioxygenase YbiX
MHVEELNGDRVFVIHECLSGPECEQLIHQAESLGFDDAPITTSAGFVMRKDVRNNTRVILDDHALAQSLYSRLGTLLPGQYGSWRIVGLNERFRFYRYDLGQFFAPHFDGAFNRNDDERSWLTFMIYLNDACTGGETIFLDRVPPLTVVPESGKALVFLHRQLHTGAEVIEGRKYVLRSDVMYRRTL